MVVINTPSRCIYGSIQEISFMKKQSMLHIAGLAAVTLLAGCNWCCSKDDKAKDTTHKVAENEQPPVENVQVAQAEVAPLAADVVAPAADVAAAATEAPAAVADVK